MYKYEFDNIMTEVINTMKYTDDATGTDSFYIPKVAYLYNDYNRHTHPRGALYDKIGELAKSQFNHYFKPDQHIWTDHQPYYGSTDKENFYNRINALLFFKEMALTYNWYKEY